MSERKSVVPTLLTVIGILVICVIYLALKTGQVTVSGPVKDMIKKEDVDFALVFTRDGSFVPVGPKGEDFVDCRKDPKSKSCRFLNEDIKVKKFVTTSITKIDYEVNPNCYVISYPVGNYFGYCE